MKQHYTLLGMAMMVSAGALAAVPQSADFRGDILFRGNDRVESKVRTVSPRMDVPTSNPSNLPADLNYTNYDKYSWKSIGKGMYRENFVSTILTYDPRQEWEVEIEECVNIPGLYRLVNPYGPGCPYSIGSADDPSGEYCNYDSSKDYYIYVHTERQTDKGFSNTVWIDTSLTGMGVSKADMEASGLPGVDYGQFEISSAGRAYYMDQNKDLEDAFYMGLCGVKDNGIVTFPPTGLLVRMTNHPDYRKGGEKIWASANESETFRLRLPGSINYNLSLMPEQICTKDNKIRINIEHAHEAEIKYMVFPGRVDFSRMSDVEFEDLAYRIAEEGTPVNIKADHVDVTVPGDGIHSVYFVNITPEGLPKTVTYEYVFGHNEEGQTWKSLGTTTWRDDILTKHLSYATPEVLEAELQIRESDGMLRLVNPYKNSSLASYSTHPVDHDHYLYIKADAPERVYIPYCALDFGNDKGQLLVADFGHYAMKDMGMTDAEVEQAGWFGKVQEQPNGEKWVTMPAECLTTKCTYMAVNGIWRVGNENGLFYVVLPQAVFDEWESLGIEGVVDAETPVEYFNMQGVKVTNPEPGQLLIKRQGSKVTKQIQK